MSAMSSLLCRLEELPDSGSRAFSLGEGAWPLRGFLVRKGSNVFAYLNRCPHAGHPLNLRPHEFWDADRTHILCNSHGATFDALSGECVEGPCVGQELIKLPVSVSDGCVWFDGDPQEYADRYA